MAAFLIRRFLEAIPVVFLATLVIFLGMRLIPGDPLLVQLSLAMGFATILADASPTLLGLGT